MMVTFIEKPSTLREMRVHLPLSKSISNRILMLEKISGGRVRPGVLSDADDTLLLRDHLQHFEERALFDCQNAGTVLRFLTALAALVPGRRVLTGDARMKQRPLRGLTESLVSAGADIRYTEKDGFPPVLINGKEIRGGEVSIDVSVSSQFVSALMLAAPLMKEGLCIHFRGRPVSAPYMTMTAGLLQRCGGEVSLDDSSAVVKPFTFQHMALDTGGDWSSAAFWYAYMAIAREGCIELHGLLPDPLQGDAVLPEIFARLGVESRFENGSTLLLPGPCPEDEFSWDFSHTPDLVPAVAVSVAGMGRSGLLRGTENLRWKESQRAEVLVEELGRNGYCSDITPGGKGIQIRGGKIPAAATLQFDSHNDHRMAMAFSMLCATGKKIALSGAGSVSKSYPGFLNSLAENGFHVSSQ